MCFDQGESCDAFSSDWPVRARKQHQCDECCKLIQPGDQYKRTSCLYDGQWMCSVWCEGCVYIRAMLYAHEIGEGCSPGESWYLIGDGDMRSYARELFAKPEAIDAE